jgi:2-haloacid dehalogenase
MTPVLAFDVNETLLDLRALDPHFERVFGDASLRPLWFGQMLQLAFVGIATGEYADFTTSQHAALRMLAARRGVDLAADDADAIVGQMSRLPAHPDVEPALDRLRGAGYRLATLTNSVAPVAEAQLEHAGIRGYFERVLSADAVRRLKPAPDPYLMAAEELGVAGGELCLVAAHPWDVSGALAAGCRAAFIGRGGIVPSPIGKQPEIVAGDLTGLADALLGGRGS